MKSKLLALSAAFFLCAAKQNAQVSNYAFTQTLSTYGAPSTGTIIGMPLQDDDVNSITFPFTFTYNGTAYTGIDVCSNGYLSFGTINGTEYTPISDASTQDLIAPFGQDLFMGTVLQGDLTTGSNTITNCTSVNGYSVGDVILDYNSDFGGINPTVTAVSGNNIVVNINSSNTSSPYDIINLNGYIKQTNSGTAPNRVCEIEYRNFTRLFVYDEVISFKVRFYETSNAIEFVYGNIIPGLGATPSEVGLKGSSNSDFNSRKVVTPVNWNASVASTAITDACDYDPTTYPVSGQMYRWVPTTCVTPTLSIASTNTTICSGETATLTAAGATSFTWTNGPSTAQYTVNPTSTTTYTLLGATSTCTSSISFTQNVAATPTLNITQSSTLICSGQSATLTGAGASTYSWNNGPNTAQYVVSPTANTVYTLTASNGTCAATRTVSQNVQDCTGLNALSLSHSDVSTYPNPFSGALNIKNGSAADMQVTLLDAIGKVIYSGAIKGDSTETIHTENLNKGFYFIRLSNGTESVTKKLVKE